MKHSFEEVLSGGTLRSLGNSRSIVHKVRQQEEFDELFQCLYHADRVVVMRAADVIEKITIDYPQFLTKHKKHVMAISATTMEKELMWHIALLIPRLRLSKREFGIAWNTLTGWAGDKTNSRIVRVHAMQGLADMLAQQPDLANDLRLTLHEMSAENIPSIKARLKKIYKLIGH